MGWASHPHSSRFLHFLKTTTHNNTDLLCFLSGDDFNLVWPLSSPTQWPIKLSVTPRELFSFSQVLVRPHCPLTNDFWFAHLTSAPAISDFQLDCSDKMALWLVRRNGSQNTTKRNTGTYWSRWEQPFDCKAGQAVSTEVTVQDKALHYRKLWHIYDLFLFYILLQAVIDFNEPF